MNEFKVKKYNSLDSTNESARDEKPGTIIVAKSQKKGCGRFGRVWESGEGGLWMSVVVSPIRPVQEYTFVAALAVRACLSDGFEVKWPNDVLFKGKKVCGILSEALFQGSKPEKVIVGIGVNVNNVISQNLNATSLREIRKKEQNLDVVMKQIIKNFSTISTLSHEKLLERYRKECQTIGKNIKAISLDGECVGKAMDITDDGELVVKTSRGQKIVSEGDVTIL